MRIAFAILLSLFTALPVVGDHAMDGRDVAKGKAIYADHCAACHGANLEGQANWRTPKDDGTLPAPPHDESGHTWHHDDQLLFDYTKLGGEKLLAARGITGVNSGMPAYEEILSDDEIWTVLAFIRSTWSDRVQAIQASRNPPH